MKPSHGDQHQCWKTSGRDISSFFLSHFLSFLSNYRSVFLQSTFPLIILFPVVFSIVFTSSSSSSTSFSSSSFYYWYSFSLPRNYNACFHIFWFIFFFKNTYLNQFCGNYIFRTKNVFIQTYYRHQTQEYYCFTIEILDSTEIAQLNQKLLKWNCESSFDWRKKIRENYRFYTKERK